MAGILLGPQQTQDLIANQPGPVNMSRPPEPQQLIPPAVAGPAPMAGPAGPAPAAPQSATIPREVQVKLDHIQQTAPELAKYIDKWRKLGRSWPEIFAMLERYQVSMEGGQP